MIKTYLAGPIDRVNLKEAQEWRTWLTKKLSVMGIGTLNPFDKEGGDGGDRLAEKRKDLHDWNRDGKINKIRKLVGGTIIPPDLVMVEQCDFITLYIPNGKNEICGCVDDKTEIFTLNGFKKYKEIKIGEKVVSYNINNNVLEKDYINNIFSQFYNEKMLFVNKRDLSMMVSPNHRCIIKTPFKDIIIKNADKVWNHDKIIQLAKYNNKNITLNRKDGRIIGLIITDGWIEPYRICICQKKRNKSNIIEQYLDDCNINYKRRERQISELNGHYGGSGIFYIYEFRCGDTKYYKNIIPSKKENLFYLLNNSQEFLEGVYEGIILGDGTERVYGDTFSQKGDLKLDFIQAL